MEIVGMILAGVGMMAALSGWIWFLVIAFQESVGWGIGCLLCGLVQLVFLIQHIDKSWKPFAVQIAGSLVTGIGTALMPAAAV